MRWLFFLLLGFSAFSFAEQVQERAPNNMVYNKGSGLAVDNINKVVDILRDPTAMSGNFRQALRRLPNNQPVSEIGVTPADPEEFGLPKVEIVGRVYSENKPSSVVLRANGKSYYFEEGDQVTQVIDNQLITYHVQEISEHSIRLLVMPFNKILIFN